MIREGDWVKYQQYGNTVYGTVENIEDNTAAIIKVFAIENRNGKKFYYNKCKSKSYRAFETIEKAEIELEEEDIKQLMDEALRTKDKRWFKQLHARKAGKKLCVECGERELYFNSQYLCEECWRDMLRAKVRES